MEGGFSDGSLRVYGQIIPLLCDLFQTRMKFSLMKFPQSIIPKPSITKLAFNVPPLTFNMTLHMISISQPELTIHITMLTLIPSFLSQHFTMTPFLVQNKITLHVKFSVTVGVSAFVRVLFLCRGYTK